jgi:hypothetical protein
MKQRYKSTDSRTGYNEGTLVELTEEELANAPFNVYLQALGAIDDEKELVRLESERASANLRALLRELGLSPGRTKKVLEKYPNEALLRKNATKAGIDRLTDNFIKLHFGKLKRKKGK